MPHIPTVELATRNDLPDILDVYFDAFSGPSFTSVFPVGPSFDYHKRAWGTFLGLYERIPGMQECKIFVIRDVDGKVKSAALIWIIKPEDQGFKSWQHRWPDAFPGMNGDKLRAFYEGMGSQHHAVMADKEHIYLEIIMTHSSARKQGHASALLAKTTALADEFGYATYLDADESAMGLYTKHGFTYRDNVDRTSVMFPMVRDKQT